MTPPVTLRTRPTVAYAASRVASASPSKDREPEKRHAPSALAEWVAAEAATKPDRPLTVADFDPSAVRTWERTEALGRRDNASGDLTRGRGFIGVQEDGTRARGSNGWNWLRKLGVVKNSAGEVVETVRQDPPVFVKGAVYADTGDGQRVARDVTEREAQREALAVALYDAPLEWLERPTRAQRKRIRSTTGARR